MYTKRLNLSWMMLAQLVLAAGLFTFACWQLRAVEIHKVTKQRRAAEMAAHIASLPPPPPKYTFPDGGRQLLPNYRLVALYGTPGAPILGSLGHQGIQASIKRIQKLAGQYQPYSTQPIMPTLEIIATIASAYPTDNHDYSAQVDFSKLEPWIKAAQASGVYVVLDLQSGRSTFLSQAKSLRPLLLHPNVGLALDPEWRLKPDQKPLLQVGSVSIGEVNQTAAWLADLAKRHSLPQKLFLLHEFRLSSLPSRAKLDTSHPQLAYAIQMDGQGPQGEKQHTWQLVTRDAPPHTYFGWKNFLLKDPVVLTPAQTMAIKPKPWYVSYQ